GSRGSARGTYRTACTGLRAGPRPSRRADLGGRGQGGDGHRNAALRPATSSVVPTRSSRALDPVRRRAARPPCRGLLSTVVTRRIAVLKGHGTENDFGLIPDADGALDDWFDREAVRRIADRYEGVGADGVIRVVRSENHVAGRDIADEAEWFMDYRNA